VALLDALSLTSLVTVDRGEFAGRGIERLAGSRWLPANIKTGGAFASLAAPPCIILVAPLRHCSILFAARVAGLFMANIASQKKRIARSERERLENLRFRSSVKTYFKRLEGAIQSGDANAVSAEHKALVSRIDKAVQRGALHRNTGARKKARAAGLVGGASRSEG
jgi:small subunit ribosomal protein S20